MALNDIEKQLYNMKEGNPLEEEEFPEQAFPPTGEEEPQKKCHGTIPKRRKNGRQLIFIKKTKNQIPFFISLLLSFLLVW